MRWPRLDRDDCANCWLAGIPRLYLRQTTLVYRWLRHGCHHSVEIDEGGGGEEARVFFSSEHLASLIQARMLRAVAQVKRKIEILSTERVHVVKKARSDSDKPPARVRPISEDKFGLIQEELHDNLYALLVQVCLWNQTKGSSAKPVLDKILATYPDIALLAEASLPDLTSMILPIGLHNRRAARLIAMAQKWLEAPPCKERRYRKVGYPHKHSGKDIKPDEVLAESDPREGYEISHLPGIGAYALDSYRMFHRDRLRGIGSDAEPEWKRVVAGDKELRAWLIWRWGKEGFHYDIETGKRKPLS